MADRGGSRALPSHRRRLSRFGRGAQTARLQHEPNRGPMSVSEIGRTRSLVKPVAAGDRAGRAARAAGLPASGFARPLPPTRRSSSRDAASPGLSGYMLSFLAIVVAPAIASTLYFTLIASDQYSLGDAVRRACDGGRHRHAERQIRARRPPAIPTWAVSPPPPTIPTWSPPMSAAAPASRRSSRSVNLLQIWRRPEADVLARLQADAEPRGAEQILGPHGDVLCRPALGHRHGVGVGVPRRTTLWRSRRRS